MSQGGKSAGHPVNVATGEMFANYTDIFVAGKFPLKWKRHYSTQLLERTNGPLGQGWTSPYFSQLTRVGTDYLFRSPDGGLDTFPDPKDSVERGAVIRNFGTFTELSKQGFYLRITRWNVETGENVRFLFKSGRNGQPWPLLFMEYPNGQGVELAWDDRGLLKGVRQKLEKRMLTFTYTSDARIATVSFQHPDLRQQVLARYEYDRKGRLATAYDALGHADRYEYDGEGRIVREIVKDGGVFSFKYDPKGRCVRTSGLDGYDMKNLRFLDAIGWTEVTNSYGHVTRYQWLATGQVVLEVKPQGGQTKTEFDEHGRIIGTTNPLGGEWKFAFDEMGNRNKIVDPLGRETLNFYNQERQAIKQVTPAGNEFVREYDASGRMATATNPLDAKWIFHYDQDGNTVKVEMGTRAVQWFYGPNGVLLTTQDPEGHRTQFKMDAFGRVEESIGPMGNVNRFRYDLLGRKVEEVRPDGTRITNAHDAKGNVVALQDVNGAAVRNIYGFCGRLLAVTDPLGGVTRLKWGTEPSMLLAIVNPKGEEYRFAYDADGNRILTRDFAGIEERTKFNAAGNAVSCTYANGDVITYHRDAVANLAGIELSDGSSVSFTYDDSDYLLEAESPDAKIVYTKDKLGRPLKEDFGDFWIERGYNADGKLIRTATSHDLEIGYALDARDLLNEVTVSGVPFLSITRNPMGVEVLRTLPGPVRQAQTVDTSGRLFRQEVLAGAPGTDGSTAPDPFILREYAWKGVVVTGIRDKAWGTSAFVYDAAEQLIQAVRTGAPTGDFRYDPAGNLTESRLGGITEDTEYGPGNVLLRKGGMRFEYDARGRLVRKFLPPDFPGGPSAGWEFVWDALDQLRSLTAPDGSKWEYRYDALGRRISKRGRDAETVYRWDQETVIHEEHKEKPVTSWIFDYHTFKPLGASIKGRLYPVVTDHLGTPREMLDGDGKVAWSAVYGPWGNVEAETGGEFKCPIRFQGQWFDEESGLHYNRWRYYDPAMGRFITSDPIGIRGGLNTYRYCPNPINWIDPMGLDWNYVLVETLPDGTQKPYYSGVSTQDPKQVEARHAKTQGLDEQPRFNPQNGDSLVPITPIDKSKDNHETARGLEQKVAEDIGSIKGRQAEGTQESARGNLQNPVSPDAKNAADRKKEADKFLADQGKTVQDLIDEGIEAKKKAAEEPEEGCGG
ncbi:MAG: RHS repeat-associated core domain-containing protein [Fibrobacteria bacterium]